MQLEKKIKKKPNDSKARFGHEAHPVRMHICNSYR